MSRPKSSFIRRPTPKEMGKAHQSLCGKEFALFTTLLGILRIPECSRKLPCLRPIDYSTDPNGKEFRKAFAICWRLMNTPERRNTRTILLWHLYRQGNSLSPLHDRMLQNEVDPNDFPPFIEWRTARDKTALKPFQVFSSLVKSTQDMTKEAFLDIWHNLSDDAQCSLLAMWWKIVNCGCHKVTSREFGGKPAFILQFTPGSSQFVL